MSLNKYTRIAYVDVENFMWFWNSHIKIDPQTSVCLTFNQMSIGIGVGYKSHFNRFFEVIVSLTRKSDKETIMNLCRNLRIKSVV